MKRLTLSILAFLVAFCFVVSTTGCSSPPQLPDAAKAALRKESVAKVIAGAKAALSEAETAGNRLVAAGILPPAKAGELAGYLQKVRSVVDQVEAKEKVTRETLREALRYADLAASLLAEFGEPLSPAAVATIGLAREIVEG